MARAADVWKSAKLDTTALPPTASASGLPPSVNPQTPTQNPQSTASSTPTHKEEQYVSEEAPSLDNELYRDAETITGKSTDFVNLTECVSVLVCCHETKWLCTEVLTVCVIEVKSFCFVAMSVVIL